MLAFFRCWNILLLIGLFSISAFAQIESAAALQDSLLAIPDSIYLTDDVDKPEEENFMKIEPTETGPSTAFTYKALEEESRVNPKSRDTSLFVYFMLALVILAYVRFVYSDYLGSLFRSLVNFRISRIFFEEEEYKFLAPIIAVQLMAIMAFGAIFYFLITSISVQDLSGSTPVSALQSIGVGPLLLLCFLAASIWVLTRYFLNTALAAVLPIGRVFSFYQFNLWVINGVFAIAALPILMILSFGAIIPTDWVFYVALGLLVCYFFLRLIRGIQIAGNTMAAYPVHFFLYLCGLEISPLLIVGSIYMGLQ